MKNIKKTFIALAVAGLSAVTLTACNDADKASSNLSKDSDNFKIERKVTFVNSISNTSLLEIKGLCSIVKDIEDKQLEVTCKTGSDSYKKHYLGISDNVTYFVEQTEGKNVSTDHYKVTYNPKTILPQFENTGND